jgi:hypothetical protein
MGVTASVSRLSGTARSLSGRFLRPRRNAVRPAIGILAAALLLTLASAGPASAEPPADPPAAGSAGDFLVHRPRGAVGISGGWLFAFASSDLYDFFESELTIERSDFDAPLIRVEAAIVVSARLQVLVDVDISRTSVDSEYREFIGTDGLPIVQTTSLDKTAVTGSVKYALSPRGDQVSALVWVPRRVVPYAGGGGGVMKYNLEQSGDFVDREDLGVFTDSFSSDGWAPTLHAFGGVDIRLFRMLFLGIEGRYVWSAADLGADFVGFDPIDLSGFVTSVGVSWVF